jgi:hypothetical protein
MPWEVDIKRRDGRPIGTLDELREKMPRLLPGLALYRYPSGTERLAQYQIDFPDVLRDALTQIPASIQSDYELDDLFLRFFLGPEASQTVDYITVEVRGDGNPLPPLSAVAAGLGCAITDLTGKELEVVEGQPEGWTRFKDYLNRAIQKSEQDADEAGS